MLKSRVRLQTKIIIFALLICAISLTSGCIPNLASSNNSNKSTPEQSEKASIKSIFNHVLQLENSSSQAETESKLRDKDIQAELELIKSRLQAIEAKLK